MEEHVYSVHQDPENPGTQIMFDLGTIEQFHHSHFCLSPSGDCRGDVEDYIEAHATIGFSYLIAAPCVICGAKPGRQKIAGGIVTAPVCNACWRSPATTEGRERLSGICP